MPNRAPSTPVWFAYTLKDASGNVIYAGMSKAPLRRYNRHHLQPWGDEIDRIELYPCGLALEARALERRLIERHQPRYNVDGVEWSESKAPGARVSEVLDVVDKLGPMTVTEIRHELARRGERNVDFASPVVGRMAKSGLLDVVDERPSKAGGRRFAKVYAVAHGAVEPDQWSGRRALD